MYKVIVSGSRSWVDVEPIKRRLLHLRRIHSSLLIIHGAQGGYDKENKRHYGADHIADIICRDFNIDRLAYPYISELGKAGGPVRNQKMIDENKPIDLVLAFHSNLFHGSKGTLDMAKRATRQKIPVLIIP